MPPKEKRRESEKIFETASLFLDEFIYSRALAGSKFNQILPCFQVAYKQGGFLLVPGRRILQLDRINQTCGPKVRSPRGCEADHPQDWDKCSHPHPEGLLLKCFRWGCCYLLTALTFVPSLILRLYNIVVGCTIDSDFRRYNWKTATGVSFILVLDKPEKIAR